MSCVFTKTGIQPCIHQAALIHSEYVLIRIQNTYSAARVFPLICIEFRTEAAATAILREFRAAAVRGVLTFDAHSLRTRLRARMQLEAFAERVLDPSWAHVWVKASDYPVWQVRVLEPPFPLSNAEHAREFS